YCAGRRFVGRMRRRERSRFIAGEPRKLTETTQFCSLACHQRGAGGSQEMHDFPKFMKSAANRIALSSQSTPGVEGYVHDGADGTQMAFWTCHETAISAPHVHDFDECMVVVQGCYVGLGRKTCSRQSGRRI